MKILEFFQESSGSLSSTRLMAFLCVCTALFLVINNTMKGLPPPPTDTLVVLFGAGFGGKLIQKPFEEKTLPEAKPEEVKP